MDFKLRIFLIVLLFIGIYMIFGTIKKKDLEVRYGMYWTIIFGFMLVLIIFPNIIEFIASLCGFKEAPNLLFLVAIFILFYIVFRIYITLSKLQEINRSLVQEISILKHDLKDKK